MFIDYVKIRVKSGQGGSGCMSFHREKFIDKGGPDGGDGGRGGSVILRANRQLRTLQDFTYKKEYAAKRGQHGMGSNKHGKSGADITLEVPVGTVVKEAETGDILVDIITDRQKFIVAKGGKGGRGNARFATATHRSPREWEVGDPGQDRLIELELKLIADIGLVGLPNAGKSTLLSVISSAKPKIAGYPFTTLQPNLGIVRWRDLSSFVVADIPGLIEGAHEGKGLGHQFLRHIERTRAVAYLIDVSDDDPQSTFDILYNELKSYSKLLVQKPAIIVMTKTDILSKPIKKMKLKTKLPVLNISSVNGDNISLLIDEFGKLINKADLLKEVEA
ncbi:MAG: GTPase ObgE [Calditrichaceae bacterium]|nr:GTPase ObgE [Calditrichaceae bacterium]